MPIFRRARGYRCAACRLFCQSPRLRNPWRAAAMAQTGDGVAVASKPDPRKPLSAAFIVGNERPERLSDYGIRSFLAGYITGDVMRGRLG